MTLGDSMALEWRDSDEPRPPPARGLAFSCSSLAAALQAPPLGPRWSMSTRPPPTHKPWIAPAPPAAIASHEKKNQKNRKPLALRQILFRSSQTNPSKKKRPGGSRFSEGRFLSQCSPLHWPEAAIGAVMGLGWRGSAGPVRGDGGVSQRSRPRPPPRIINPAGQGAGVRAEAAGCCPLDIVWARPPRCSHRVVGGPPCCTQPKPFFIQPSTTGVLRDRRPRLLAPIALCADTSRSRYTGPIQRADWRGESGSSRSARRCGG